MGGGAQGFDKSTRNSFEKYYFNQAPTRSVIFILCLLSLLCIFLLCFAKYTTEISIKGRCWKNKNVLLYILFSSSFNNSLFCSSFFHCIQFLPCFFSILFSTSLFPRTLSLLGLDSFLNIFIQ